MYGLLFTFSFYTYKEMIEAIQRHIHLAHFYLGGSYSID